MKTATLLSLNSIQESIYKNLIGKTVKVGKKFVHSLGTDVEIFSDNNIRLIVNINRLNFC